jgi:hypothetical protein
LNSTDTSENATVTFNAYHADGSIVELTMPATIVPLVRLRSCGSMRITVTSNASHATNTKAGTPLSIDVASLSETIRWTIEDAKRIKAEYKAKTAELIMNRKMAA